MEIKRRIDSFLKDRKARADRKPLIVKGALQIGKTFSMMKFAKNHYAHVVEVTFALRHHHPKQKENPPITQPCRSP